MDLNHGALLDGLLMYLCFIPVLTFHEFAHAWVAWKRGDDTAYRLGRVSLNPVVHMELIGTVVLPLLVVFLHASGGGALARFIIGWGKPVPVDLRNLYRPRLDDTLVALAGPAMNVALAVVFLAVGKLGVLGESKLVFQIAEQLAILSLFLCFFNLLPIPPLDGSHVLKNVIGMSDETYARLCQFGFIAVIVVIQLDFVRRLLGMVTGVTYGWIAQLVGLL
jgi:Zn-dependent protease